MSSIFSTHPTSRETKKLTILSQRRPVTAMHPNTPKQLSITSPYRNQSGMTLIEIMIALLIGAFLIGGVLEIFINSKQTYRVQEGLSRLQENGRFAMDFLAKDIRKAGYKECLTSPAPTPIAGTNNAGLNASDTITVQLSTGACGSISTITYSIQTGAGGQPALFVKNDAAAAQEQVEGIENMQILYGADTNTDNTPDYYVPAGTVGLNMTQVVSIRISLLAATVDNNLTSQPLPYTYNGTAYSTTTTPAVTDRKIRRVFNSTIAVRNRLP
jgi:type IV pilus assembly protein PilW